MNINVYHCHDIRDVVGLFYSETAKNKLDLSVINRLLKQLNPEAVEVDETLLNFYFIAQGTLFLLRADDGELESYKNVIGMASLTTVTDINDFGGILDNVVIDERYRSNGYSRILINDVIEHAKKRGMKWLEVESHPSRTVANYIYRNMGFTKRETNVYEMVFSGA